MDHPPPQHRSTMVLMLAGALTASAAFAPPAAAGPVRGVRSAITEPIAVRGGVLLLALEAESEGDDWPNTMRVRLESGRSLQGVVVWQTIESRKGEIHWTAPPVNFVLRPIHPDDDSSKANGSPLLLVELPADGHGPIRLPGQTLDPIWCDPPTDPEYVAESKSLERIAAPHRPDPESPFEYWRWVLVASRHNALPPAPGGSRNDQLVARYMADLWRIGFARLAQSNPVLARRCRDLLTQTCFDGGTEFAAWITEPAALRSLLGILLDFERTGEALSQAVLAWINAREELFLWFDGETGNAVRLAVVNPGLLPRVATFRWQFDDPERNAEELPIGVEIRPGRLRRVQIDRPRIEDTSLPGEEVYDSPVLVVESAQLRSEFRVRPQRVTARPPGVYFGPFPPVLTLAQARAMVVQPPPAHLSTNATFRRTNGRWEVFFECFRETRGERPSRPLAGETGPPFATEGEWRGPHSHSFANGGPGPLPAPPESDPRPYANHERPIDTRGSEAVTLFIGPGDRPAAAITIPEEGDHRLWAGTDSDQLRVVRRQFSDRWYCRVVLPDEWLDYPASPSSHLGFMRTHGGSGQIETSPNPAVPWRIEASRIEIDLTGWSDLPR